MSKPEFEAQSPQTPPLRPPAVHPAQEPGERERIEAALERKTQELAETLARMRATIEATTDGILVTNEARQVTDYNQNFLRMWQLTEKVVHGGVHDELVEMFAPQLRDPDGLRRRLDEIYADSPPETYDLLEFIDGRVFERFSKTQRIEDREVGRVWSFRDITERMRAERELRDQTEWFSVTLGSIGDAVITVDTARIVTFLNPVAEKLTGWFGAEALGRSIADVMQIVYEASGETAINPIDRALTEGEVVALGSRCLLLRRDGTAIPIEDTAAPIKNPAGETIGAVMVFHDVTERRQRELALARSEERYRLMGQVVPQLLWSAAPAGDFEYGNERWHSYTGQSPDQSRGQGWLSVIHPDDAATAVETWQKSVEAGHPFEFEARLRSAAGEYRWFVARGVPRFGPEGQIVHWYGSCTDFHQQKLTADALREEYTITEHLHEVATALATELDLGKVVQIITDAGTRITRAQFGAFFYNLQDEGGTSFMLYTLSGVPREKFDHFPQPQATALFGPTFRGEGVIRSDDIRSDPRFGGIPPFFGRPSANIPMTSYLAVPVHSRGGEVIGGLFFGHSEPEIFTPRDEKIIVGIAAQAGAAMDTARLYQNAQQARAAAEHASQAKDMFLAALSHELRTPLTPALALLSSLRDDTDLPEELRRPLEMVERNIELEARLIDDLLDLTRITRGKLELHRQHVSVVRMIECAIDTCLTDLQAKNFTLVRELQEPERVLTGDTARLTQILWNLLKNAIKFTPRGGTITVRSRRDEVVPGQWIIEVSDSGIGIEPSQLNDVFDAFQQGDRNITRKYGGLGLGLAISKAIAESHGGSLVASSEGVGRGSTFTLRLPLHVQGVDWLAPHEDPGKLRETPPESVSTAEPPRTLRILLVEDHVDTASVLTQLLGRMGHHVAQAGTVREGQTAAEQLIAEGGIDLVVSDIGLPDGSGLDLMRELSSRYGVRGIALSGFGMDSDLAQSRAAGFSRHLIKPLDIAEVRAAITAVMKEPRPTP